MITRTNLPLIQNDDAAILLEAITIDLGFNPSFGTLRSALEYLASYVVVDVKLTRPGLPHDCTGKPYTQWLEQISRDVHQESKGYKLVAVYKHAIGYDW